MFVVGHRDSIPPRIKSRSLWEHCRSGVGHILNRNCFSWNSGWGNCKKKQLNFKNKHLTSTQLRDFVVAVGLLE
jgi:hypothetical protein